MLVVSCTLIYSPVLSILQGHHYLTTIWSFSISSSHKNGLSENLQKTENAYIQPGYAKFKFSLVLSL